MSKLTKGFRRVSKILESQQGCCFYCGKALPVHLASIEHLVPLSHCGSKGTENLVACCRAFNHFLGPIPFKLKVQIISDAEFIERMSRWCQSASFRM